MFFDGTVLTVAAGRDGKTVFKIVGRSRPIDNHLLLALTVPSRREYLPLSNTVPSRRENLSYLPVPPTKLPLHSRPADKNCPYTLVPPSKPAYRQSAVRLAVKTGRCCHSFPSRFRQYQYWCFGRHMCQETAVWFVTDDRLD